jgi:hypothetical protein
VVLPLPRAAAVSTGLRVPPLEARLQLVAAQPLHPLGAERARAQRGRAQLAVRQAELKQLRDIALHDDVRVEVKHLGLGSGVRC